ncbi:MAG: adenosylcobinamide-GDP ribazoletransferase [Nitrosomonadales bacterium]|nr:adenosylcobinamide-GDP ribazoletransferase [Nitrosomonadales bacterium]
MRGFILALQFLTRLPTPQLRHLAPAEMPRSAQWFPLVGLIIGALLAGALWLGSRVDPWLGALLALLGWVWVTGALHLDGLADMSDAMGAAHRERERFLAVLADPHLGTYGVLSLVLQLITKLVLLMLLARNPQHGLQFWALLLIPAWARWGALLWARLPSLKPGLGASLADQVNGGAFWFWLVVLMLCSTIVPMLLVAPVLVWLWQQFLLRRLGGMTGDTLGAGVELVESAALLVLVLWPGYWLPTLG